MESKSAHKPEANVMSAKDVWDDAQQIAEVLKQNLLQTESVVHIDIPLSSFLSALDSLTRDELEILHKRIEKRLAV